MGKRAWGATQRVGSMNTLVQVSAKVALTRLSPVSLGTVCARFPRLKQLSERPQRPTGGDRDRRHLRCARPKRSLNTSAHEGEASVPTTAWRESPLENELQNAGEAGSRRSPRQVSYVVLLGDRPHARIPSAARDPQFRERILALSQIIKKIAARDRHEQTDLISLRRKRSPRCDVLVKGDSASLASDGALFAENSPVSAGEPAQKAESRVHGISRWQEPSTRGAKPETSELPQPTRAVLQRADDEWSTIITDARTGVIFRDLLYPNESQRSLVSETCEEIDSTSICAEPSRTGTVPSDLSTMSTQTKNAKVTHVVPDGSQNRLREPALIKTTTASRTQNTVSEQGHCERLDWVELQQRIASDSGLFGNRHALGLERYLNAAEIAEATRLGVPGTMRASDGFLHDEMDYLREFNLEERAVEEAVARYRAFTQNAMQRGDVSCLQPSQRLLLSWFYPVTMAIHQEQERIRRGELSLHSSIYGPHLLRLKPEVLAVIVLHETLGRALQDRAGVSFCRVSLAVGRSVQAEINLQRLRELHAEQRRQKLPEDRALRRTIALSASGSGGSRVIASINAAAKRMELDNAAWDDSVAIKVGSALISFAMKNAMIYLETPSGKQAVQAFRHTYRPTNRGHRRMGVIELHNSVIDLLLANEGDLRETILPRFQPMIVPPRPWTAYNCGGYLRPRGLVMRIRGSRLQLEALKKGDLSEVYAGLNALGATPWRVNRPVLEVVEKLWQAGGDVAGLVARADLQMPSLMDSTVNPAPDGSISTSSDAISMEQRRAIWRIRKTNRERHALRCELHYRLETAREFAHVSRFYLPHNLDFRGRAYPMPSHLHHMSSDVCRGLLTFAEPGLRLGERGLFWLKIHLANLCGKDKLPFEERVAFAESVMPKVLAVAAAPTADANLDWWARQEEPFQLLATCFELAASKGGRDPDYCCTLPVHQDGSCNGLQHYAALGRDACGGAQVNLLPSDRPQDVYSGVAELVRARVAQEAREGVPIAKLLDGRICRKIVKQTVMTSVYGVTLVGAREQIQNRLRELADFPDDMLWQASYYLAKHTLSSLGDIFRGATDTMEWLAECAFRVATSRERTNAVYWITPLGLPVIQPYRRREARLVNTVVQHVLLEEQNDQLPVSRARQRSAFPPNYIHSLDSTHMLMTAIACQRAGLQFAAVHDSFWTHAANVDQMNRLLRETFVRLHSRDLLQELREQFQLHFPEVELPPVPPKGTLDLNQVLLSPYFFN